MRSLITITIFLTCLSWPLQAAHIDVNLQMLPDSSLKDLLIKPLTQDDARVAELRSQVDRVLISWNGRHGAPTIRYQNLPARAIVARLREENATIETGLGEACVLPRQTGFAALAINDEELAVIPRKGAKSASLAPWPQRSQHIVNFFGAAGDMKMGDLKDELLSFVFTWSRNNDLSLNVIANNRDDAIAVYRYVKRRRPLIGLAAMVGVDAAKFPARLLNSSKIAYRGSIVSADAKLEDDMQDHARAYLVYAIERKLRKIDEAWSRHEAAQAKQQAAATAEDLQASGS